MYIFSSTLLFLIQISDLYNFSLELILTFPKGRLAGNDFSQVFFSPLWESLYFFFIVKKNFAGYIIIVWIWFLSKLKISPAVLRAWCLSSLTLIHVPLWGTPTLPLLISRIFGFGFLHFEYACLSGFCLFVFCFFVFLSLLFTGASGSLQNWAEDR